MHAKLPTEPNADSVNAPITHLRNRAQQLREKPNAASIGLFLEQLS